jgi:glyceraldehyde-3-phosphate dehydrogenase/erythrose-4-phosphate dehydrogenase
MVNIYINITPLKVSWITLSAKTNLLAINDKIVAFNNNITIKTTLRSVILKHIDLKWGDIDVDVAIDCTGFFLTEESCQAHIDAGAKKVVQSAPAKDSTPMFVYGDESSCHQ